jgi:GntR family transcriptional regulator
VDKAAMLARNKLDPTSPVPLWVQLSDELRLAIEEGRLRDRLPSEPELRDAFGVSRSTVREAIRRLRIEGYLDARQGRGTFVVPRRRFEGYQQQRFSLAARLADVGEEFATVLDVKEGPDERAASRLGVDDPTFVIVRRLRGVRDEVVALEEATIVVPEGRVLLDAPLTHGSIYEALEQRARVHVTAGIDEVSAINADESVAGLLSVPVGTALMLVERRTYAGSRPIEYRRTVLMPERIHFIAQWGKVEGEPSL